MWKSDNHMGSNTEKNIHLADAKNEVKIGSERQLLLSHYLEK